MRDDTTISARTRKLVFQEAASHCAFCRESDVDVLDVCHIDPRANGGATDPANLILACATCHRKMDSGVISPAEILAAKRALAATAQQPTRSEPATAKVLNFHGTNRSGIVANVVKITTTAAVKMPPPAGIIAADADRRSYVKRLIDRYNDFKRHEMKGSMQFQRIYAAIKREFKCKWDYVPISRFDDLVAYLQHRIDSTILGKINRKNDHPNYTTFEQFVAQSR